ncbi:MAG: DUF1343 domain-containing protein [Polyangiales bacterium]
MRVGLDRLLDDPKRLRALRSSKVGLLAHPASVTRHLTHALDALSEAGIRPRLIFGPEHGYQGSAQDMASVADQDARLGETRRVSLYGSSLWRLSPQADELAEIDLMVIDLQDVGARYYTFVWTALLALRACAAAGVRVLLLDRPNPINGVSREGAPHREARLCSFVGLAPIPIRHAMTLGEVVSMCARREGISEVLEVLQVEGWDRNQYGDAWDRAFVMPSPNMPTVDTAVVYPGGCLIEATNLSEGRGTTRPFELVGAPFIDGVRLARELMATELAGFRARATAFEPTFQKHQGTSCGGVQIHVVDRNSFRPVATYLALLALARGQEPSRFALRDTPYEYVDPKDAPALDLLCGTVSTREALMGGAGWREVMATVADPTA